MPVIEVKKPFGLRLGSDRERRDFSIGEYSVSDEELDHWFVQACLKDGRAVLVRELVEVEPDAAPDAGADDGETDEGAAEPGEERAAPTREELMAMTVAQLKEMAALCGLTPASNATKAVLVDALLAGRGSE